MTLSPNHQHVPRHDAGFWRRLNALNFSRLRYELRVTGMLTLLIPVFVLSIYIGLALLVGFGNATHRITGNLLAASLETGLSLAAGLIAATVTTQDAAIELQLSMPAPYQLTITRRMLLLICWSALLGISTTVGLEIFAPWALKKPFGESQWLWLAPMLWFAGTGAIIALLTHSRSASASILGGVWLGELLLSQYFFTTPWAQPWFLFATLYFPSASFWFINRLTLSGAGVLLLAAVWFLLRDSDRRLLWEED